MPRMIITLMLMLFINLFSYASHAITPAGTRIINQAQASYFDTGSGQIIRIVSNYATLVVAPHYDVEQDRDQNIQANSGQLVYFPHTIVNTGNQSDTYQLSAENMTGDNGDLLNLKIYLDENGDGQVSPGETEITNTESLQPGQLVQVVVTGTVPNNSEVGDQYTVTLETQSTKDPETRDKDLNTVTTSDNAIIRISRITDTDCGISLDLNSRSYHEVNFTNIGNQAPQERSLTVDGTPINGILIQENVPEWFQLLKDPAFFSEPTTSILLVGTPLGEWNSYNEWNGNTVIDKLGILIPTDQLKPNQSGKYGFTYQVQKLPTDQTRLAIQSTMDIDNDGVMDFQSNASCNTIKPEEDLIIKERPTLVLTGTVFDSGNLTGLPNVIVGLISSADNIPVATTSSNNDGYYEFSDVPAGEYYLQITPALGFEASKHSPDYFTTYTVSDPSYGLSGYNEAGYEAGYNEEGASSEDQKGLFYLDPEKEAVLLDIPLDREGIRGQISINKTASADTVSIGEPLAYTVSINNLTEQDLYATYIVDLLPEGFKYVKGTAKLDGEYTNDPVIEIDSTTGRSLLRFRIGDFTTGTEHKLSYITQVTALASGSNGINTAYAHGDTITDLLVKSPTTSAQVNIAQNGVLSDRAILFGRVAMQQGCKIGADEALIANGFPLAGVRLYLEDGTYVVTDADGQFSLYGLQPGIRVLKIDNHTLPSGLELMLTDNAQVGDPDSRFVDLLPGDFYRADFTAACPEQVVRKVESCPEPAPQQQVAAPQAPKKVRECINKPVEKKITKMVTRSVKNVIKPVHFDSGKAVIPPSYIHKLNKLVAMTRDKKNVRFQFVGHTDNQRLKPATKAKFSTNQGLSEARAAEVAQYVLENLKIKTRVSIDGKGETQPIASNSTAAGMSKNRRVELVMLYDEPKVSIQRSSKRECRMKTVAATNKIVNRVAPKQSGAPAQTQCVTRTITEMHPVATQILARAKTGNHGWQNEIEALDPANSSNLQNLSRLAANDGDISSGLIEAYRQKITRHQENFAREQSAKALDEKQQTNRIPDPKEAVKTITRAQGKAGTWLWPKGDISLDGRFMAIVRSGVSPTLHVNGKVISGSQLGEQIENRKAKAQILAWYGVELQEGENTVKITAKGPFGNERTLAEKIVKRPSSGVAIRMKSEGTLTADGGRSTVPVNIEILDRNGYLAKGTYFLTLEASDGHWAEPDIQDKVPGHQVKVTNGQRTVHLRSSRATGQIRLSASTGKLQSETDIDQVAELRPLIAVGLLDIRASKGYRDSYESFGLIQLDEDNEDYSVNGRAALFMKGRIKGNMHLTLSYDNQKDSNAELLRDIDPGEYYRVYGDSSQRGFEAQSRSQLYAKLEKNRHSIMWGDYLTDNNSSAADIARAQRTLTGLNAIYDNGKTRIQAFASRPDNMRGFVEIPGNGTAMLYRLEDTPIVENSEVIELVTRDRENIGLLLAIEPLKRFRDYTIDDISGYITFHRVIPTLDDNLNPVSIRISYDRIEEGESYLVAGVRLMHQVNDELKVGASYTHDEHETDGYDMAGVYAEYEDETSSLEVGLAQVQHNDGSEDGNAIRIKASKKWSDSSRTELLATQADETFTNTGSSVIANRREVKLSQHQKLGNKTEGKVEFSHSESLSNDEQRQSLELSATTQLDDWKVKGGVRQIRQTTGDDEEKINTAIVGVERNFELLDRKGSIKAEYEREIGDEERQRISVGADMQLTDKTKGYVRYEQADRLSSGTLAGAVDTSNNLVMGVKSKVLPSTEVYSEYRIEGGISGEDVVAASGAKATFDLEEDVTITPSLEVLKYLEGDGQDSIAASVGYKDTRDARIKKILRAETRHSDDEQYYGLKGTYVRQLNDSTTVMLQDELRFNKYDDEREDQMQNTLNIAAAHRPKGDGRHNAIYGYRWETDDADNRDTHILSTHQHYQINESLDISGRLGAKKKTLRQGDTEYDSDAVMADARAQWDVTDRVSLDVHGGVLATNGFSEKQYSLGAGVNVNVMDNMQVGAGYNFKGFEDEDLDADGRNAKGMYFGLQLKADEALFSWLADDEKPLVDADCKPNSRLELTDRDQLEKQRKQIEACQKARGLAPSESRNYLPMTPENNNNKGVR